MRKALVKRGDQIVEVMVDENTFKKGGTHGGLDRWFAEEWVDIKTGKPCGRQEGENRKGYPACRPSKRVSSDTPKTASELSSSEKEKFKRSKQSSSRIPYQHKRKEDGGESNNAEIMNMNFNYQDFFNNLGIPELKSGGNKPTNPSLWSRAKSLARSKFDVYPSAYANGWAAKWYKGKGGGWRKAQMGGEESDQMEEIIDQIEDALEQGAQPEEILQQLVQMGIEQEQAQMLIQEAIQDLQEDATENELPEAQIGGQGQWMQDPSGQYSLDEELRTKVFPAALATIAAGAIPMYFKRRKEKRQEREEQERLEKENEETPTKAFGGNTDMFGDGGSYRVYKTSERKGKTHKVVGPGGVTKYFGDPKLGERSKSKYGKKGFYARHKKNLAKNPFFRAYARATWAEGGEPSFMQTPEFKTNSFIDLVRQEAESNVYKNIMNQAQEMFMQMGGAQDYGYVGNPYADMYQQKLDDLQAKDNVENAFFNGLNQIGLAAEKGIKTAANIIAPGSGAIVGMAMDAQRPKSLTDPTSKGMSTEGMASMLKGVISDPEALTGLFAKKGGSLPKAQDGLEQYFGQFLNPKLSDQDFNADVYGNLYDENGNLKDFTPLPPQQEGQGYFESPEDWRKRMEKESAIVGENKNWDPLVFSKRDMNKYNLDPNFNNVVQKPKPQISGLGFDPLLTGASILTAMGNRGKAEKLKVSAPGTESDSVFAAVDQNQTNFGDFDRNTGKLMKPYTLGTDEGIPALARYGGGLRRAKQGGVQKEGVYMSYPTATPESVLYGEQPKKPSNTLQPVKREFANLEAEDGETVIIPARDGLAKFFKIGGERHSNGGTPLNLPDGSFIFSDTKSMKLGGDILKELGIKGKKKRTPAKISKMLGIGKDYEKFIMIIQDPNSDKIERRTAELMIENQIKKLGMLALAQEAKKGFPEGIPMIAVPYMESVGIAPEQVLPQPQINPMDYTEQIEFKNGGSNIIGTSVIPLYQDGDQVKRNPAQAALAPIFNRREKIPPPISKSVWEQYPDAWKIFQSANQSRDINMIRKAQDYLDQIDVPFSIGFPGTDQDIIENAANTLRDRSLMLERDYKKAKKEYEHNKNINTLSTLKQQIIEVKKNTPKTPENIDKLNKLDLAIKDLSEFTPNDIVSKINKYSYLGKNTTTKTVINEPIQQKNNTVVQDTVPVVEPSTPKPTQSKPKSVEKKSETKKNKVTFGADDLNGIQIIQY